MATALFTCSLSTPIPASSGSGSNKSETNRMKPPSSSSSSSTNWWAPLFGWPSDPGYSNNNKEKKGQVEFVGTDNNSGRPASRFSPGCFTEEKAKQLRRKTAESSSFHDVMYHSALASRLASDMSVWSEK